jgi:hypothetical protein
VDVLELPGVAQFDVGRKCDEPDMVERRQLQGLISLQKLRENRNGGHEEENLRYHRSHKIRQH